MSVKQHKWPSDELQHNGIEYVDLDEDVIIHWKYIKRKKLANGKWRYYYDQSELDKRLETAVRKSNQAYVDEDAMNKSREEYEKSKGKVTDRFGVTTLTDDHINASKKYSDAKNKYAISFRDAQIAVNNYKRMKAKSFAARTISKGAVAVANMLSKLF
jgi:hypothetical protein